MIEIWKILKMFYDIIVWIYNVFGCVVEQRIGEMIMVNNINIVYICIWYLRCVCYKLNYYILYQNMYCYYFVVFFIYKKIIL